MEAHVGDQALKEKAVDAVCHVCSSRVRMTEPGFDEARRPELMGTF